MLLILFHYQQEGGVEGDEEDWGLLQAFVAERHTEKIQGLEDIMQNWRLKDRVSKPRSRYFEGN